MTKQPTPPAPTLSKIGLVLSLLAALHAPVTGQASPIPQSGSIAQSVGRPATAPNSLAAVLDKLNWDPEKSGVLLLVAPERLAPRGSNPMAAMFLSVDEPDRRGIPDSLKPPPLPAPPAGGYRLDTLAPTLRRKLVKEGIVSTLAPIDVPKPLENPFESMFQGEMAEMFGGMDAEPTLLELLASLTPGQWSAATSTAGLGREQCDASQVRLLDRLLPMQATFWYPKGTAPAKQREPSPEEIAKLFAGGVPSEEALRAFMPPALEPVQAAALRLRLTKDLAVDGLSKDSPESGGFRLEAAVDESRWESVELTVKPIPSSIITAGMGVFSQIANNREPAFPKKSDVNTAASALRQPIPLADIRTVGALVERVAKAVGVALVCDKRIADTAVHIRGDQAPAGDLLRALSRAAHGTFRKLGEGSEAVFFFTKDLIPSARSGDAASIQAMASMAPVQKRFAERQRDARKARAQVATRNPFSLLSRGDGTDLPESLWQSAETSENKSTVPIAGLSERWRKAVRDLWSEMDEEVRSTQHAPDLAKGRLRLSALWVNPTTAAWATVAQIDAADLRPDANQDVPVDPLEWPAGASVRVARVARPVSPEQAKLLGNLLRERGFTHWMLETSVLADDLALPVLVKELSGSGLRGIVSLAPLHGEVGFPSVPRDISVSGQPVRQWANSKAVRLLLDKLPQLAPDIARLADADYVVPEVVEPLAVLRAVERAASLPGVAAVALADLAPPGYSGGEMGEALWNGGGTLGARMRFVRAEGIDPADLQMDGMDFLMAMGQESLFDGRSDPSGWRNRWNKDLAKRRDALYERIDTVLSRAKLAIPVVTANTSLFYEPVWERWSGKWKQGTIWTGDEADMDGNSKAAEQRRPSTPKTPPSPERWLDVDVSRFSSVLSGFGSEADIDDPHVLRPADERLAAWISNRLGSLGSVEGHESHGESEADEDESPNGFVLDLSTWKVGDAMTFLAKRVAVQAGPASPATSSGSLNAKPVAPDKPVAGTVAPAQPVKPAAKPTVKAGAPVRPAGKPKASSTPKKGATRPR